MGVQVSIARAKAEFAALIARAEAGEEVVVTRNGRPVARIAPIGQAGPVRYGDLRGLFLAEDLDLPEDVVVSFEPREPE